MRIRSFNRIRGDVKKVIVFGGVTTNGGGDLGQKADFLHKHLIILEG